MDTLSINPCDCEGESLVASCFSFGETLFVRCPAFSERPGILGEQSKAYHGLLRIAHISRPAAELVCSALVFHFLADLDGPRCADGKGCVTAAKSGLLDEDEFPLSVAWKPG